MIAFAHSLVCVLRSAQIALGSLDDQDFLRAKRWDLGPVPNWRAYSNNSVICSNVEDALSNSDFWGTYEAGEPMGLVNLEAMRTYGRAGDTRYPDPRVEGCNPCAEQGLANTEVCCLSELILPRIQSKAELLECARLVYIACKRSLTLPCPESAETQAIVRTNMRIGIGITGYMQATEEQKSWLPECYEYVRAVDEEYSRAHGLPPSVKLTTVKPSGTLSLLADVTPGCHPAYSQFYIRRVRIAGDSPLLKLLERHGYGAEPTVRFDGTKDYNTWVVSFPCRVPEGTVLAEQCSAIQQLEVVRRLQRDWSDNSVSVTVTYRKDELPAIKKWLQEHYELTKSVSFLLYSGHGFVQAPLEPISEAEYEALVARCTPLDTSEAVRNAAADENESLECAGGACPAK